MQKHLPKFLISYVPMLITLIMVFVLIISSIGFKRDSPDTDNIRHINTAEISVNHGDFREYSLPADINNLEPLTPVTLKTVIRPQADDGLYFKTIYSKADVYFDDQLVFTFGKDENYPEFMQDPATEIHVIETYGENRDINVRIEMTSPETVRSLHIFPLMLGSAKEIILDKSSSFGLSWVISISLIISGISLILTSLGIAIIDRKGIIFTWLGLFSLVTGSWFMGSNDFAITVFPDTTFLYMMSFIGVIMCLPALLQYISAAIDFTKPEYLKYIKCFTVFVAIVAFGLQLLGILPLHISRYFTRLLLVPVLIIVTGLIIYESAIYRNTTAKRFVIPMIIFTISAAVEVIMKGFPFIPMYFPPALIGTFLFLLIMGFIAGLTIKDSVELQKKEKELAFEKKMLDLQTEEQRENKMLLVKNEERLSRQRHDLRHHLTVISQLAGEDNEKLQEYISTVIHQIPARKASYCENGIVNAVISHFASECESGNIRFKAEVVVPDTDNFALDSDLCVVFANLLENATEACNRMEAGDRFITIKSSFNSHRLVIFLENSFSGIVKEINGNFYSSKRDETGTGLCSVKAIAEKYHGSTRFRAEEKTFVSSVYLTID